MLFRWHTLLAMRKTRTVGATITPTSVYTTESTLFSDRQKGLEADTTLTEVVLHQALCVKHLVNNVVTQTKIPQRNASTVVWKLAKTEYREEAEQYLREIKQTYGPDTHKYLLETGLQRWSDAYWPENVPRWAYLCKKLKLSFLELS